MIHRRLFKKYSTCVEELYQDALGLVKENWDTPRQVLVLGNEKAFEAADFSGADIAGGFDLDVEYGTSLPLDPNMAREQLMLLMPALKEAGLSMKQILRRFKLNEIETVLDRMELSADRQREIFEEMIARAEEGEALYIAPKELEEHQGMLEYAYDYIMSSEYKYLPEDIKLLIERHIKDREALAAQGAAAAQPQGAGVQTLPGTPGVSGALKPELVLPE
jgi:NurA-like 5'-3' nuclease